MTDEPSKGEPEKRSLTGKYLVPLAVVTLLSLATWSYFYAKQMPFTPADTSFVVGCWLLVVFAVRWVVGKFAGSRKTASQDKNK